MQYWLFKSEPHSYSFEHLRKDGTTLWSGVRNYQARNTMMTMNVGDLGFFYHSSIPEPHIAGICKVVRKAFADPTQFDANSEYYDPKATPEKPRWMNVEVAFEKAFPVPITLAQLRAEPPLEGMVLLSRGSRLSVQPVTPAEWKFITKMLRDAHCVRSSA